MRKKLSKMLLAGLLIATVSYAETDDKYIYDSNSLVGIEGGMATFDIKDTTAIKKEEDFNMAGFKVGAETRDFRMFLSARKAFMNGDHYDWDKAYMYGAELQYKFNVMDSLNFFIGGNIGRVSFEFKDLTAAVREYTTKYIGGDVGINYHINDMFDLELGARLMTLSDDTHTLGGVTYTFDDITNGYMSLIVKFQMD
ncbi:outer membrane beta-barrel protein [Sulfurimonas sp.]|uniref:outer membrane beta-barrel protein n=1 Tax=Sulfurimonas sp. TaxID=2022749 RepID=UPI00356794AC